MAKHPANPYLKTLITHAIGARHIPISLMPAKPSSTPAIRQTIALPDVPA
ncbi:MAG: hypothetical protein COB30_020660 [Ectothiorhodospiraceae bacterium]|nr:hypothetical protein [Ectothiorhodospiraceae bacterium]